MAQLKTISMMESGDKGKYTSKSALHRENKNPEFKARWYGFEFICHHDGKAIIKTDSGRLHEKADDYFFLVAMGE